MSQENENLQNVSGISIEKPFSRDLLTVLFLTITAFILLIIPALIMYTLTPPFNYVPYILLLLFLPGYALLAANNSLFDQYSLIKRVISSVGVSLFISVILALLLTYTPLKIFDNIIIYIVIIFTILLSFVALGKRRKYHYVHYIDPEYGEKPVPIKYEVTQKQPLNSDSDDEKINTNQLERPVMKELNSNKPDEEEKLRKPVEKKLKRPVEKESGPEENDVSEKAVKSDAIKVDNPGETDNSPENLQPEGPEDKPSKRFAYLDLVLVILFTIFCTAFILLPSLKGSIFETVLSFLLIILLPGYAVISTIYPRNSSLSGGSRLIFSFAVSYFLTTIIGLALNYTSYRNDFNYVLLSLAGLTMIFSITALVTRWRVSSDERFSVNFSGPFKADNGDIRKRNVYVMVLLVAVVFLVFVSSLTLMKPVSDVKSGYTDFYVLGPNGNNFTDYPSNITTGENGTVTIVLVNHESTSTTYNLVTTSNKTVMDNMTITLKPDEKKEIKYNFTAGSAGKKLIEVLLFKLPNTQDAYHTLSFWINIVNPSDTTSNTETTSNTQTSSDTTTASDTGTSDTTDTTDQTDDNVNSDNGDNSNNNYSQ